MENVSAEEGMPQDDYTCRRTDALDLQMWKSPIVSGLTETSAEVLEI